MKVFIHNRGRLGNIIFRLFSVIVFATNHNTKFEIVNTFNENFYINDNFFVNWANNILLNIKTINFTYNENTTYIFHDFHHHYDIFIKFKPQIIKYIFENQELKLITDRNDVYNAIDLVKKTINKSYYIVVHLRLEDFIDISLVMNPLSISNIIDKILIENPTQQICFVLNTPKTELEKKYLNFFYKKYNNIVIESNDVITDFLIMKYSKILVCSCSTLSWAAGLLSNTVEKVYLPNYICDNNEPLHKNDILNVELYNYTNCNAAELLNIL